MPSRCVCDRSRVYLFPISGKKHVKRLECACRTKKDRSEAWGESVPKQRGPTQVGIPGVGRSHRYKVQQHFSDNEAFPS